MTPPQDHKAEEALLGAVLIDNSVLDDLELLPEDFFSDFHRRIFTIMLQDHADGKPVDVVTLNSHLNNPSGLSAFLDKVPTAASFQAYAQRIKDKSIMRKILIMGKEMIEAATYDEDPRNILDDFEDKVLRIGDHERAADFIGVQENMSKHLLALRKDS